MKVSPDLLLPGPIDHAAPAVWMTPLLPHVDPSVWLSTVRFSAELGAGLPLSEEARDAAWAFWTEPRHYQAMRGIQAMGLGGISSMSARLSGALARLLDSWKEEPRTVSGKSLLLAFSALRAKSAALALADLRRALPAQPSAIEPGRPGPKLGALAFFYRAELESAAERPLSEEAAMENCLRWTSPDVRRSYRHLETPKGWSTWGRVILASARPVGIIANLVSTEPGKSVDAAALRFAQAVVADLGIPVLASGMDAAVVREASLL